jgi:hypothetical protein
VDFHYLIHIFYIGEITSLISMEKTSEGSWWVMAFLVPSSSHGVIGVAVRLPWESRHLMLVRAVDQWAKATLSARVAPITGGNWSFAIIVLPHTISCVV